MRRDTEAPVPGLPETFAAIQAQVLLQLTQDGITYDHLVASVISIIVGNRLTMLPSHWLIFASVALRLLIMICSVPPTMSKY